MVISKRTSADGTVVNVPTTKVSAIQTNPIVSKGEKTVRVGGNKAVQKPIRFKLVNDDHENKKVIFIGTSGVALRKLGGDSVGSPDDISGFGTLEDLAEDRGDETWYVSGMKLKCSNTDQFSEMIEYVQANNGKFQTEELAQEIDLADDGDNYADDRLTIRFADGHIYPFNKRTGFAVTLLEAADESTPNVLYLTLVFSAGEDRVMGESI